MCCDPFPRENDPACGDALHRTSENVGVVIHHDRGEQCREAWFAVEDDLQDHVPFPSGKRTLTMVEAPSDEDRETGDLPMGDVSTCGELGVHVPRS